MREVDLRRKEARRGERLLAARGEIGERGCEQRAADAVADDVALLDARLAAHRVGRRQDALLHVVLEGLVREVLVGVDPGDHEDGEALADQELDEALGRRQIEDVVLVDPGRHDQERPLAHLVGRGRVLDELQEVVLIDDLAGRGGEVAPDLEGRGVRLADSQQIAGSLMSSAR